MDSLTLSRRAFLQAAAAGVGGAALATVPGVARGRDAWAAPPVPATDGILVVLTLYGGNDGLNTVVPYGQSRYYQLRPNIAIPQNRVLALNDAVGLHPNLVNLKSMYDRGRLAIVQGVGYPNPSLSHFDSMATWMAGNAAGNNGGTGWLGRYLDGLSPDELHGVSIGTSVPLIMKGSSTSGIGVPDNLGSAFGANRSNASDARMFDAVKGFAASSQNGAWGDRIASNDAATIDLGGQLMPAYLDLAGNGLARSLMLVARLINANLGIRVINLGFGGFDNHADENPTHDALMTELDVGMQAFFQMLDLRFAHQVTLMTMSEFGRRAQSNDSAGTDHGTASCLFVAGANVRGGLYGSYPSLSSLDRNGNLGFSVDFRSVYASVLGPWLAADSVQVIGGGYEDLQLFRAAPGIDPATGGVVGGGAGFSNANGGYWMLTSTGDVLAFGNAGQWGGVPGRPMAAIATRPNRDGYWLTEPGGAVHPFGGAVHHGDMSGAPLVGKVVAMAATPTGDGYWLVGSDGGVFSFGDAKFYGSMGGKALNAPVLAVAPTATGKGYWLAAGDGGVFSFGDARFYGSMGGAALNAPVVAIAPTATGKGYWLVAGDGGVFSFGDARFYGSTGSLKLAAPVVGVRTTPAGKGYWLGGADGGVFAFGDAGFFGSGAGSGIRVVGLGG